MGCIQSSPESNYAAGPAKPAVPAAAAAGTATVIWFPEPEGKMPCRNAMKPGGCRRGASCQYAHGETSLTKFLSYLGSAKRSVDICVFTITCNEIADCITDLHKRGVRVRIITDDDQSYSLGSDIKSFRDAGIPVKLDHNKSHMHHKFAIIDGRMLLNGSFNWTRAAVLENQENVTVLENAALAQEFGRRFEWLWQQYRA